MKTELKSLSWCVRLERIVEIYNGVCLLPRKPPICEGCPFICSEDEAIRTLAWKRVNEPEPKKEEMHACMQKE